MCGYIWFFICIYDGSSKHSLGDNPSAQMIAWDNNTWGNYLHGHLPLVIRIFQLRYQLNQLKPLISNRKHCNWIEVIQIHWFSQNWSKTNVYLTNTYRKMRNYVKNLISSKLMKNIFMCMLSLSFWIWSVAFHLTSFLYICSTSTSKHLASSHASFLAPVSSSALFYNGSHLNSRRNRGARFIVRADLVSVILFLF